MNSNIINITGDVGPRQITLRITLLNTCTIFLSNARALTFKNRRHKKIEYLWQMLKKNRLRRS